MSALGILLFVFVGWLVCSIGHKLVCASCRLAPLTLLLLVVVAGSSIFGHGCEGRRARAKRAVAEARREAAQKVQAAVEEAGDDAVIPRMPKRAGEVPVAAELARTETLPPTAVVAPSVTETPAAPVTPAPPAAPLTPAPPVAPLTPAPPVAPVISAPVTPVVPALPAGSDERPAWVDAPARLANSTYSIAVKSGLYASLPECQRALDTEIKREADHYINEYLGDPGAAQRVDIPIDYLKTNVKKAEFGESVKSESVGTMYQIHALMEFDDNARADFHQRRHDSLVTERLWVAGAGAAVVLALVGTLYGYLKLDLRGGRARVGRLQLAATLVAMLLTVGALVARWAVP
jgi:hypothetical protein